MSEPSMWAPEPNYRCRQCLDDAGGWIVLECPRYRCGRLREHQAHAFAVRCPCWLRRHADGLRMAAQKALQAGQPVSAMGQALQDLESGTYAWSTVRTERAEWSAAREQARMVEDWR